MISFLSKQYLDMYNAVKGVASVFIIYFLLFFSCVWLFATLWTVACQAPLSSTISQSLHKFMSLSW